MTKQYLMEWMQTLEEPYMEAFVAELTPEEAYALHAEVTARANQDLIISEVEPLTFKQAKMMIGMR